MPLYRLIVGLLLAACTMLTLISCGDSKAAGTADFATVTVTGTGPAGDLNLNATSTTPVTADYTVTSSAFTSPNTGQVSTVPVSDLTITNITVTLTPANASSPTLGGFQTQFPTSGQQIIPGSTKVTIPIVPAGLKSQLQASVAAGTTVTYNAVVQFQMLEANTNRTATISVPGHLVVNFTNS